MARNHRTDSQYEIESLTKGIKVLEALENTEEEGVNVSTVMERTGYSRDTVDRCLKTLRMHGYAKELPLIKKWTFGNRLLRLSERYSQICLRALAK